MPRITPVKADFTAVFRAMVEGCDASARALEALEFLERSSDTAAEPVTPAPAPLARA